MQYKGTKYCGFCRQNNELTIEAELKKALATLLKQEVSITVAGRTDAGVHALGQVINFSSERELDTYTIRYNLNAILPPDIQASNISAAVDDFDARHSATARQYVYYLLSRRYPSVFNDDFCYHYPVELDLSLMKKAASYLAGEQNFKAFSAYNPQRKNFTRNVMVFELEKKSDFFDIADDEMIKITIKANSFLYRMVRNIVGTLVEVGRGKIEPEEVKSILKSQDRKKAAWVAPAKGLFLEKVFYDTDI